MLTIFFKEKSIFFSQGKNLKISLLGITRKNNLSLLYQSEFNCPNIAKKESYLVTQ